MGSAGMEGRDQNVDVAISAGETERASPFRFCDLLLVIKRSFADFLK
jgi:hypothetical protein